MSTETDSNLLTALRLLHSKSRSSADQLKALLDDAISAKRVTTSVRPSLLYKPERKISAELSSKGEKRVFEKVCDGKKSFSALSDQVSKVKQEPTEVESKKSRLLSPPASFSSVANSDLTTKVFKNVSPAEPEIKQEIKEEDSEATDIDEEIADNERSQDFALEGLACVVCKHIDTQPNNQLVECQECHNLYHQDCHKPPITDEDISDPRVVWYCSKCTKSMKKLSNKSKNNNKSPNGGTTTSAQFASTERSAREQAYQLMKAKETAALTSPPTVQIQPFKRVEPKTTNPGASTVSATTKPAVGLAGFAANLTRTTNNSLSTVTGGAVSSSTSSSTVTTTPSTPPSASNSLMGKTADKRLQQMKKKAAKGQEKKRFNPK